MPSNRDRRVLGVRGCLRLLVALAALTLSCYANAATPWLEPSRDLARKIADITGPGTVAVDVGNRSTLSKSDVAGVKTALDAELVARGVHRTANEQAAATVVVTLLENVREYVWVAEIQVGKSEKSVVIVAVPRADAGSTPVASNGVVLRKQLLWTQEEAILDVAALDAGAHLAVLDGSSVTILHTEKSRWQKDQELPVQHGRPWPRDLRGRLIVGKDHLLDAYLPGVHCQTTQRGALALECEDQDKAWPLEGGLLATLDARRNYFTGVLPVSEPAAPGVRKAAMPTFYSAVALPRDKYTLWVLTGVDGTVHALDGMTDQVWRGVPWGSDIAAVHTGCGSGWQVVASGRADTGSDELRVYDVPDREPMAMSAALGFPGKITALWGEETQAIAVVHNEEASRYEAYRVLFACGD